jgi:hypothetical protein
MSLPSPDEVAGARQTFLVAPRVGRLEPEHGLSAERAHPGVGRGLRDRFLEVVHVGKAGDARPDHLRAAEMRAEADELGRDELPFDRHHVAHQPDVQPEIVGQAAQQRHRRMGVGIDQAGHHDASAAVERLGRRELERLRTDRRDRVSLDRHGAGRMLREVLVHRHDVRVGEKQVARGH